MTKRNMIMKLWDYSGHASDLYPFLGDSQIASEIDINAEGTEYFLRLLSEGQVALVNWKKRDGRRLRFRNFYISKNIRLGVDEDHSFTVTRTDAYSFSIDPTQTNFVMDISAFENSVMVYNSSYYKVLTVTEITPTNWTFNIHPDMAETEDVVYPETLTEVQFGLNEFDINSSGVSTDTWKLDLPERVYTILRIDDYESNEEITRSHPGDELDHLADAASVGTPTEYQNLGAKIVFDTALLEKRWYRFELLQQPDAITDLDSSFDLPEPYHQALALWCAWQIAMRERQEIHMTNYRNLLDKELMYIVDPNDNDFERTRPMGFKVRRS